ncbi:hypothetical protein JF50_04885 [Pseudoalteromonas luteoviolacea]|uniref:Uncharacterized protein n=1 Tax=Pseudoalteromonas luteoviolacea TaxID=43657 RepID=A0A0C1QFM4_9GAMM|nr:hypothetical protein [Pseudoalteromonas luteoviolacea]KID58075.1 hypothetical protein JF50_04885 [Pseudoalteromonas luteoviolacea]
MKVDDLIDEVIYVTADKYKYCIILMLRCLKLISDECPKVASQSMKVANDFWVKAAVNSEMLDSARVECWNFLDANSASTNIEQREFCAVRAVICVLYPEPFSDDNGELLDWFFKMLLNIVQDNEKLIEDSLDILESMKSDIKLGKIQIT